MILNLVKWGEGGIQYHVLMTLPLDEVLDINKEASRINRESKREIDKASKR